MAEQTKYLANQDKKYYPVQINADGKSITYNNQKFVNSVESSFQFEDASELNTGAMSGSMYADTVALDKIHFYQIVIMTKNEDAVLISEWFKLPSNNSLSITAYNTDGTPAAQFDLRIDGSRIIWTDNEFLTNGYSEDDYNQGIMVLLSKNV